jgi:hypothetical protein
VLFVVFCGVAILQGYTNFKFLSRMIGNWHEANEELEQITAQLRGHPGDSRAEESA